jgi:uncharacterized protein (TIGR02246 family)
MPRFLPLSVALAALAFAPTRAPAQDVNAAVRKVVADYVALCNKGDARGMAALYTEDAVWIDASPDGIDRTVSRPAIEKQLAAALAGPFKGAKCTLSVVSARAAKPDVALAEGTYVFEAPGQPPMKGMWLNVAVLRGGKWLIAHEMAVGK